MGDEGPLRYEHAAEIPGRQPAAAHQLLRTPPDVGPDDGALKVAESSAHRAADVEQPALTGEEARRLPPEAENGDLDIWSNRRHLLRELRPEIRAVQGRIG